MHVSISSIDRRLLGLQTGWLQQSIACYAQYARVTPASTVAEPHRAIGMKNQPVCSLKKLAIYSARGGPSETPVPVPKLELRALTFKRVVNSPSIPFEAP